MRKMLHWLFLLVLLSTIGTTQAQTVNYNCDFESPTDAAEWAFNNGTTLNKWFIGTAVNHTMNGATALYVSSDANGATNDYAISQNASFISAYKEINLTAGSYDFSYDWRAKGEGFSSTQWDYLRVALIAPTDTIPLDCPSGFYHNTPTGWIALDDGHGLNNSEAWQTKTLSFTIPTDGLYKLVFFWRNDYGSGYNPAAAVDNITLKTQTCPTPSDLVVSNIVSDGATIAWTENGSATNWQVEYGEVGFMPGTGTVVDVTGASTYAITGLNANSMYDVYVRSKCSADDVSMRINASFRTGCGALAMPFFEDFENQTTNRIPSCWSLYSGSAVVYSSSSSYSGSNAFRLKDSAVVFTPPYNCSPEQGAIYFAGKRSSVAAGTLEIGYVTDTMLWDYVMVTTINPIDDNYHLYDIDFESVTATADNFVVVIKQVNNTSSYSSWYIDDVTLYQLTDCRKPTNCSFSAISNTSAMLSWDCATLGANFQIRYNGTVVDVAGATSVTLTDLAPNTSYSPEIRTVCNGTEYTPWYPMGTFVTNITCASLADVWVGNKSDVSASINWIYSNSGNDHTNVIVRYKADTVDTWTSVTTMGNGYIITGLSETTMYNVELLVLCGQDTSSAVSLNVVTSPSNPNGLVAGMGTNETSYVPLHGYYNNSFSQSIYPGGEIGNMTSITGIKYHTAGTSQNRNINIYLANTDKESFGSASDYIPLSSMTKVYSGAYNFTAAGWDEITFTTPFVPDGRNVVVCVTDTTGTCTYNHVTFRYHQGSSLYRMNDGHIINPAVDYLNTTSDVPDVQFVGVVPSVTCKAPVVSFASSDASSITLNWVAGMNEPSWCVDYRVLGDDEWVSFNSAISTLTTTITGLQSGTYYEARVGSLCGSDTMYAKVLGATTCGSLDIPYFNDFNSGKMDPCWIIGNMDSPNDDNMLPEMYDNKLSFAESSYVIMPEAIADVNTLQLSFKMDVYNNSNYIFVGVCSERNIGTFVPIDTVFVDPIAPEDDIIVRLDSYLGDGSYIAFLSDDAIVSIDDLHIEAIPACPPPIHVHAAMVGGTYITIAWDGVEDINAYNATIVESGQDIAGGTTIVCYTDTAEFSDLALSTAYDIYISSNCYGENSENVMLTVTTKACDPLALPYATDFTVPEENNKWTLLARKGNNKFMIGSGVANGNANALFISDDNIAHHYTTSSQISASFAYLPILISESAEYVVQYDWICKGESSWDFGRVALVPASINIETVSTNKNDYSTSLPTGWIDFDNGRLVGQNTWQTATKKQNLVSGTYNLVVVWFNDGSGGSQPPLAVDNLSMMKLTCAEPTNVAVTNITSNAATISWSANENAINGWEISLNGGDYVAVMDTFYTYSSLMMGTTYNVNIRTVCSEDDMSIASSTSFTTLCADIDVLPYANNFDSYTDGATPTCWTVFGNYPNVYEGELEFYKYSSTPFVIGSMPRIGTGLTMDQVELSFRARGSSSYSTYSINVGVCTQAGVDSTFTTVETISVNGQWQDYFVTFENYSDTGRYISFELTGGYSDVFIDDVVLTAVSPCSRPIQPYIDNYTHQSAEIRWTDTNAVATYKVAIGITNDISQATVTDNIITQYYVFDNLNPQTNYHAWVAADCSTLDASSAWVYVGNFTTNPACASVTNLRAYDIDESHATLTWDAPVVGEPVTDYIVSVTMNSNAPVVDTIQENYMFLSNLMEDSNYVVTVTTMCDTLISMNNTCSFVPIPAPGCNTIGLGTERFRYAPAATYYNYSISQMLYMSSEMQGMGDTISGVTFNRYTSSSYNQTDTREIVLYMGMTDLTHCGNGWVDTNSLTVVYRGSWNLVNGLCPITFTTPFIYSDHTKNLVLLLDDNTGSWKSSEFYCTTTDDETVIYKYSDGVNVGVNSDFTTSHKRPNAIFDASCAPISCFPPSIVVTELVDTAVSIVWRAGNDETAWTVEYKSSSEDAWTVFAANTSSTSAIINGLNPGTDYTIRVGSLCGSNTAYRSISVTTECGPMPLPFKEDFTSIPRGKFSQRCWNAGGNQYDAYSNQSPIVANLIGNGHMLLLYDNAWAILPEMRGNLNELQVRLRYLSSSDSIYSIVGYVDNPASINTFHPVDTIYDYNDTYGYYYTVLFNGLPSGTTGNIAFYTPHDINYTFIDDIIVEPIRTCVEPTDVAVTNITSNAATISWVGTASNYVVEYGETGFAIRGDAYQSQAATGNTITLSGLEMGTTYDVRVRAVCGTADTSYASNKATFTTECAAITTMPFVMNFELPYLPATLETGVIPNCWTVAYNDPADSNASNYPQIVFDNYGDFVANGDYALRMKNKSMVALPEMGVPIDTLCLHFHNRVNSLNDRIVVGILDHVGDNCQTTFQVVDTIVPVSLDLESYTVYFSRYTGNGKYITLQNVNSNDALSTQYFDSIVVDYIPSCPEVIHTRVVASTSSTITIDWDDVLAPASSYEVSYLKAGLDESATTTVIANAHPFIIGGLTPLTSYDINVRPICGDGDTGIYAPYALHAQTSMCDNSTSFTTAPNGPSATSSDYPMAAWYRHSYSQTIIDAQYLTGMTTISFIQLKEALSSNGYMDSVQVWIAHTDKTQFTSKSDWVSTSGMSLVFTGDLIYDDGNLAFGLDTAFDYDGTSNLVIAMLRHDGAYQRGHEFDVVSDTVSKTICTHSDSGLDHINPPTGSSTELKNGHAAFVFVSCGSSCELPVLSSVTNLTHESATINWVGSGSNYEVAIRAQEELDMSDPIAVTGNTYTFTNLTPNVSYAYYVRQVCDENEVSNWVEGAFTTNDLPCFAPTNLTVVSKTANTITLNWTASEGQQKWVIRAFNTLENHIDTVTSKPGTIVGLTGGFSYNITVQAICATNYASEWSDTIVVSTSDCLPVNNVAVSAITANSAKVTWTAGGSESNWQINYGLQDFGQGEGEIVESTTNSYTLTSLEPETIYDVYVRAMCTEEFSSVWSEVVRFTTLEGQQGIDGVEGNFQFLIYPNPTNGSTTISLQGVEGQITISVVDMNGRTITAESIECGVDCEKRLDVTGLAQGTYFVRILGDDINSVRKLIVR